MPTRSRTAPPLLLLLLSFLALLAAVAPASGAPLLRPDPSFGTRGVVEPRFPPHYGYTSFLSLSVQPDGSLLAARHDAGNGADWLTYRHYDAAGRLDPGFEPRGETPGIEAVDTEGKTLRAGSNAVERFNPDGTRDPSFGTDPTGGRPFSDILWFRIEELLPTPSGKIIVAGSIPTPGEDGKGVEQIILARLDHQGRLDPGFGGDGLVKLRSEAGVTGEGLVGVVAHGEEGAIVLVDEAHGAILLAGRQETRKRTTPLLHRFSRSGTLDRGFASRMRASSPSSRRDEGLAAQQILPTANRIFTVAPYRPVLAFSRRGAFQGPVPFEPDRKPRRSPMTGALQAGRPLLVGEIGRSRGLVLRRYLTR